MPVRLPLSIKPGRDMYLNDSSEDNRHKLFSIVAMTALGAILLAAAGEAAMYVMPPQTLYYMLVDKVFVLAAAVFLLMLGVSRVSLNSVRNLIALSILLVIVLVVAWQLDQVASGILWNGAYPSVYGRIPDRTVTVALQCLDVLGIVLGTLGGFLVLLKLLDLAKDRLTGHAKTEELARTDE